MKKTTFVMTILLIGALLTGCAQQAAETPASEAPAAAEESVEEAAAEEASSEEAAAAEQTAEADSADETAAETEASAEETVVRVGSLQGPTTMGIVSLRKTSENGEAKQPYEFIMSAQPAEIASAIATGDLDIALLPANLAATLYQKTNGGVKAIDLNTLGVLYCVTGDETVSSVEDLAGRTVLTTGQGATPEYALRYLLSQYEIEDCEPEFKSEATEVAALLKEDPTQIAILPQPFVTAAIAQNEALSVAFSLQEAWDALADGSRLVTGVTIVRTDFLNEHPEAVETFLEEHAASVEMTTTDPDAVAELIAEYGIIEKAPVAKKALPACNIVCITGEEMHTALEGYLTTLYELNPEAVGGDLPAEDFYMK
ncbi:MAG: ABC transporter substrate-binding protein [Lachnospiraceae bacterium]|nr:ABC transporter substrate-binding protein [Lachnospiraceae bacterium]